MGLACCAGATIGQLLAGFIGPQYGWWLPFLLISLPAMLCVLVVFITTTEPVRKSVDQEKAKDKESIVDSKSKLYTLISTPSVFLVLLQGLSIILAFRINYISAQEFFNKHIGRHSWVFAVGVHRCFPE